MQLHVRCEVNTISLSTDQLFDADKTKGRTADSREEILHHDARVRQYYVRKQWIPQSCASGVGNGRKYGTKEYRKQRLVIKIKKAIRSIIIETLAFSIMSSRTSIISFPCEGLQQLMKYVLRLGLPSDDT
jgi:hypothetical protein